jgi:predicted nucleic acid-binding Zn ribbon protein
MKALKKRTPIATDGPEALSDVVGRLFIARGWGRTAERARLEAAWAEAAVDLPTGSTRVAGLRRKVLEVEVATPILLQELTQFHKKRLLAAVREKLAGMAISDLKFRAAARSVE